jgi:hypothetical protein
MNDNIVVIFFLFLFLLIVAHSLLLNKELSDNFTSDFCKNKRKISSIVLDSRLFEFGKENQIINVVSFSYTLDDDFVVSLRNRHYRNYQVTCEVTTAKYKRGVLCSYYTVDADTSCTLDFPNTFNIRFKEEERLKTAICYLILFTK